MHFIIGAFFCQQPRDLSKVACSKGPVERLRGKHSSCSKRILIELKIDLGHTALDLEHATASAWLGSSKIAGLEVQEPFEDIFVDPNHPEKAWVHMGKLARELKITVKEVQGAIKATQR